MAYLLSVIRVLSGDSSSGLLVEVLDSLVASVVELARRTRSVFGCRRKKGGTTNLGVDEFSGGVDELVGVSRVSVLEPVSIRYSSVSEEDHDLMERFGILTEVVPERVVVLEVRLRVSFLSVDEVGELGGVSQEAVRKDGESVMTNND